MTTDSQPDRLKLGRWTADRMTGRITGPGDPRAVEPKVMDLLFLLGSEPGRVRSRAELLETLWPGVVVGEDVIARSVFKLRAALRHGPDEACSVETIPKRGYRLLATDDGAQAAATAPPLRRRRRMLAVAACAVATCAAVMLVHPSGRAEDVRHQTVERARDAYFQYSKTDNDAAITLFERVLAEDPANADALAGLSSAVVQQVLRWPAGEELPVRGSRLQHALRSGRLRDPGPQRQLLRALALADAATALEPDDPEILRARGLALAALDRRAEAAAAYREAIRRDEHAWGAMINLADLLDLEGRPIEAAEVMARAYHSMSSAYAREPARVRPWFAEVGLNVARRRLQLGDREGALHWHARTLRDHPQAAKADQELRLALAHGSSVQN